MLKPNQKVAIYMEGFIHSDYGKMGLGVARYLQNRIVGIIDSKHAGSNINKEHPIERNIPIYEKLDEVNRISPLIIEKIKKNVFI